MPMALGDALAWLDGHQNLERMLASSRSTPPDLGRMQRLADVLGHPERAAPAIHVTGTNGKTSTSRAITSLLMAKGLSVGTYISPHLEAINERISVNGIPIGDEDLASVLADLAGLEPLVGDSGSGPLTWFELLTAAALRWFADVPVDVMVIEVGIGGRFDATNVVDASVAVVTNIGLDHTEFLGPTRADVAGEKSGIVKAGATLVLGEPDAALYPVFASSVESVGASALWWAGRDYEITRNDLAVGGRVLDLRTPASAYGGVWLDLHGRHQADNFAAALVAAESFFAAPIEDRLVREAAGSLSTPGRLEVVNRRPLVVLDGAKNLEGARAAAAALESDFGFRPGSVSSAGPSVSSSGPSGSSSGPSGSSSGPSVSSSGPGSGRSSDVVSSGSSDAASGGSPEAASEAGSGPSLVVVFGMLAGKDPTEMLKALGAEHARLIVACLPPSPRAVPTSVIVEAARSLGGPSDVMEAESVADAVSLAMDAAGPDDIVLVAGSLYVVGAARSALVPVDSSLR